MATTRNVFVKGLSIGYKYTEVQGISDDTLNDRSIDISGNAFVKGNASFMNSVQVNGTTTLMSVNASSINVRNGLIYDPFWNVGTITNTTHNYTTAADKSILGASYTALQSGFYKVDAYLNLSSNIRTTWYSSIETNNDNVNTITKYVSPYVKSTYFNQNMNEVVKLKKGDKVEATVYCGTNVSLTTQGSVFRTSLMTQFE
jgi:hypothetical protein